MLIKSAAKHDARTFRPASLQRVDVVQQHTLVAFGIYLFVNLSERALRIDHE